MPSLLNQPTLTPARNLKTLVENRSTYSHNQFELNVFETHLKAHQVELQFNDFVLTSMFRGKKVMHLSKGSFDYLPGESVVIAPGEKMVIDFPEACPEKPTQCLAVEISKDLIQKTVNLLNENYRRPDACGQWTLDDKIFHLMNGADLASVLNRVVHLSVNETANMKDALLDLSIRETIIRLMQTQARSLMLAEGALLATSNPMAAVINYMLQNLETRLSMDQLASQACMSRAKFFTKFKEIFGQTPAKMLLELRLKKAAELLEYSDLSLGELAACSGFENYAHFATAFKKHFGQRPSTYRQLKKA
jgi:AraC-like DNA-binding protein